MSYWNPGPGYQHIVHHYYPAENPPPQSVYPGQPYSWVPVSTASCRHLTSTAVSGGHEANHSPIWIARTHHAGDLIPGKLVLKYNTAYIGHNGEEHKKFHVEVLCAEPYRVRWVPSSYGGVPPGVITGGFTVRGEPLFVGRAHHYGGLHPGKINPSHQCIYITWAGREYSYKNYEALTFL